jgi:hypothetical protein
MSAAGNVIVNTGLVENVSAVDDVMMSAPSAAGTPDGRSSVLRVTDDGNAGDVAGGAG